MNTKTAKLALDYCLGNAPASDAAIARAYVERLERLAATDGPAMIDEVGKRLAAVTAERDALEASLEASRADAERLARALSYARPRYDTPEYIQRHGDALDAHRALTGEVKP